MPPQLARNRKHRVRKVRDARVNVMRHATRAMADRLKSASTAYAHGTRHAAGGGETPTAAHHGQRGRVREGCCGIVLLGEGGAACGFGDAGGVCARLARGLAHGGAAGAGDGGGHGWSGQTVRLVCA